MTLSITETFARRRQEKKKALMPFLTSGYPDEKTFLKLMTAISEDGADLIEVGIPFSDPLADGSTIQRSSQKALSRGVNIDMTFDFLSRLDPFKPPVIIMSYLNPIYYYGFRNFVKKAHAAGVRGLIIPDVIPEEGRRFESTCQEYGIDLIYLLAPTSDNNRTRLILNRSRGFVYLVSVAGVTGARNGLPKSLLSWISDVKQKCKLPVCVGFGISNIEQARTVAGAADGVIIGSALIDRIASVSSQKMILMKTKEFINNLRKGLDNE